MGGADEDMQGTETMIVDCETPIKRAQSARLWGEKISNKIIWGSRPIGPDHRLSFIVL